MQGTNAHANVCKSEHSLGMRKVPATGWRRQRFWYEAPVHQLLVSASVLTSSNSLITFQTQLQRGVLANLNDHQIQGQIMLPGAAMFEMAAAAAGTMTVRSDYLPAL